MKRFRTLCLTTLLAILVATAVQARVFLRREGRHDLIGNLERLGGSLAYQTQIRINGGDGKLTVVSFDDALDNIMPQIRRVLAIPQDEAGGTDSALHILRDDASTTRLLLLRMQEAGRTLAIAIEQSNADFAASQAPQHQLKVTPPYPGSTPLFYAEDADTRLRVAVSETMAQADSIQQFYDRELKSRGWIPSLPEAAGAPLPTPLYVRKSELCYIAVTPTQTTARQRITVLHKELGNKDRLE